MRSCRRDAGVQIEPFGRRVLALVVVLMVVVLAQFAGATSAKAAATKIGVWSGNGAINEGYSKFAAAAGRSLVDLNSLNDLTTDESCLVLPIPQQDFTYPQVLAISSYFNAGGTILAIGERNASGYPFTPTAPWTVLNNLAAGLGVTMRMQATAPDQGIALSSTNIENVPPFTNGVVNVGYLATTTLTLTGGSALVNTVGLAQPWLAVQQVGGGRFVFSGDSNAFSNSNPYTDFYAPPYDNGRLARNLCGDTKPPAITINTPPDGARYKSGAAVNADWFCTDPDGNNDVATTVGTVVSGSPIDTVATSSGLPAVAKNFTVTCVDLLGNSDTKTHTYKVDPSPPVPGIATPIDGGSYPRGAQVAADWICTDPDGDTDVDTDPLKTFGTKPVGQNIDTTMPGGAPVVKTFSVTCTDKVGNSATKVVQYTVKDESTPDATATIPPRVRLNQEVLPNWACTDADGAGDIDPDPAKTFATVANGSFIFTGLAGAQGFSVTCTDLAGNNATKSFPYFVDASPPTVAIAVPVDGGSYPRSVNALASWTCNDEDGPSDIDGSPSKTFGTRAPGQNIDTGTFGVKSFSVTCTDLAGNSAAKTVQYTVISRPPDVSITVPKDGATYDQAQVVAATYACTDPDGASDLKSCTRAGGATGPVDTSKGGTFAFTVNAEDLAGNTATKTVHYSVRPKATAPAAGVSPASKPGAKKVCTSRRQFRIRVRKLRGGVHALSATVFVNGKKTLTRKGKRVTAMVTLKGLKKGQYRVKINVKYSNGKVLSYTRKFKTCTPKGK